MYANVCVGVHKFSCACVCFYKCKYIIHHANKHMGLQNTFLATNEKNNSKLRLIDIAKCESINNVKTVLTKRIKYRSIYLHLTRLTKSLLSERRSTSSHQFFIKCLPDWGVQLYFCTSSAFEQLVPIHVPTHDKRLSRIFSNCLPLSLSIYFYSCHIFHSFPLLIMLPQMFGSF